MVDHFHEQVAGLQKIGGQARAMVVTSNVQRAISYFYAIRVYLTERKSPYRAIAAFSGEHTYDGERVTEASLNGFSSNLIADKIQEDPYRFLICADKFQTGYDEPLLHAMYVDKILSGVKAVQTLSRLNRAHPKKHDAFVLDFNNDADTIQNAFAGYYRTTVLAEETDPDRLHDLKSGARWTSGLQPGASGRAGGALSLRSRARPARPHPGRLRLALPGAVGRGTARWTSRARQRRSSGPTGFWQPSCPTPTPSGRSSPSS